jgi:glycerophosphoryl diester phosphodiesterase
MKTVLLGIAALLLTVAGKANTTPAKMVTLSNYIFSDKAAIGRLINGSVEKVEVVSNRDYFTWKKGQLQLTKKGEQAIREKKELTVELAYLLDGKPEKKAFRILHDQFHRNPVIAHRGAWKTLPTTENSIKALQQAVTLGCAGSEFDVHMTKDDSLVVNHDAHFKGKAIEDYTYSELSQERLDNGEILPTLRSYLEEGMKQYGTKLIVEIKPTDKGAERAVIRARKTLELVHELGAQAWANYISFDYNILLTVRQLDPTAHVQFLNGNKSPDELKKDGMPGLDYHYSVFQKNENWIADAKKQGMVLNVWTVNDEKLLRYFLEKGFPMITTNEPELLFSILKTSPSVSQ